MLFLPVIPDFAAGVAWYGFPYSGGSDSQPRKPVDAIGMLAKPLLMIHGSSDKARLPPKALVISLILADEETKRLERKVK